MSQLDALLVHAREGHLVFQDQVFAVCPVEDAGVTTM